MDARSGPGLRDRCGVGLSSYESNDDMMKWSAETPLYVCDEAPRSEGPESIVLDERYTGLDGCVLTGCMQEMRPAHIRCRCRLRVLRR